MAYLYIFLAAYTNRHRKKTVHVIEPYSCAVYSIQAFLFTVPKKSMQVVHFKDFKHHVSFVRSVIAHLAQTLYPLQIFKVKTIMQLVVFQLNHLG